MEHYYIFAGTILAVYIGYCLGKAKQVKPKKTKRVLCDIDPMEAEELILASDYAKEDDGVSTSWKKRATFYFIEGYNFAKSLVNKE